MPGFNELDLGAERRRRQPSTGAPVLQPVPAAMPTQAPAAAPPAGARPRTPSPGYAPGEVVRTPNNPAPAPAPTPQFGKGVSAWGQPQARTENRTALMESTYNISDPAQQLKSPKAAFLSRAPRYGYNELPQLLKDLQADKDLGPIFQGWDVDGDKLVYRGSGPVHAAWGPRGYVNPIDVIGSWDGASGGQGWRWGVDEGEGALDRLRAAGWEGDGAESGGGLEEMLARLGPAQAPAMPDLSALLAKFNPQPSQTVINVPAYAPSYAPTEDIVPDPPVSTNPAEMPLMDGQTEAVNQALRMLALRMPELMRRPAPAGPGDPLMDAIARLVGARA